MNGAKIKPLEWHNFDAWTHWSEGACGTYHVEERNGYWPELQIDHINGDVTDNRISNLREVSASVNGQNCKRRHDNTTGVTGVSRTKNSFRAEICVAGKRHRLGQFRSIEQAIAARKLAEREMGFHENHGR